MEENSGDSVENEMQGGRHCSFRTLLIPHCDFCPCCRSHWVALQGGQVDSNNKGQGYLSSKRQWVVVCGQ